MMFLLFVFISAPVLLGIFRVVGDQVAWIAAVWAAMVVVGFFRMMLGGVEPERQRNKRERPVHELTPEDEYNLPSVHADPPVYYDGPGYVQPATKVPKSSKKNQPVELPPRVPDVTPGKHS